MTNVFIPAVKAQIVERSEPHCIAWINAKASLWGNVKWHDLDEPMPLTDEVPVRLRFVGDLLVTDRKLTMKTKQAGLHVALRFAFRSGEFFEVEVPGVKSIHGLDQTIEITRCA